MTSMRGGGGVEREGRRESCVIEIWSVPNTHSWEYGTVTNVATCTLKLYKSVLVAILVDVSYSPLWAEKAIFS